MTSDFTFCVCTYNSGETLRECLRSIRGIAEDSRLIVVDHNSQDETIEIASMFSAEIHRETMGLGYARQLCLDLAKTQFLVFVDSDVVIEREDFLETSYNLLSGEHFGAVVGVSKGHRFAYGLPASLLVLRKNDFSAKIIPDYIDARETFFIQRRLDKIGLKTFYVADSIIHRSQFRRFKPEWEGANTRILPSPALRELAYALKVVILMSLNSQRPKNIAYVPVFYVKFLVGFANPGPWQRLKRE